MKWFIMKDGVFNPLWMKWSRSIDWDAKIELPKCKVWVFRSLQIWSSYYIMAPNLLLTLSLLYCSWCLVPKSRAGQILHFIFLYIFFQRLAVEICLVFGFIFISNVLLDIESFHPLFMSGNQLTEVSPQAQSFRQYSSCDGKLPDLGSQLLWPRTFEAQRACSVFIFNLAERTFYQVARVLGRVGVWKFFPFFSDCL